ncbi:electron transfer flavoprotein subunit alpha/FixB family protein [Halomonas sp. YLGW01]|uniref:electron transfer flavoprotein subunit alpha n=1 Tax=Halomonas sp. YLGW01 TaxID=2773308 RepID=UPI00177EC3CD|nr:electron transfer flavoprotein subunit alpha/FixB family protein [Halomonas sp. YLGW01]
MSEIKRRDPRQEWITRNRLHPLHLEVLATLGGASPSEWLGPNGLKRKDPRAVGFLGPHGVKRIDRSGGQQGAREADRPGVGVARKPLIEIAVPAFLVAVVPDMSGGHLSSHDRDLLGLARRLADADPATPGAVAVVTFGPGPETLAEAGADRLLELEALEDFDPERRLVLLEAVERELAPRHWLLPDSVLGGGDLGRRLAARLGERPATGVWQLARDDEAPLGWLGTARAAAGRQDLIRPLPRLVLALEECAEPVSETRHAATPLALSRSATVLDAGASRIEDLGPVAVDPAGVALAEAEFILSAGNGVRDWDGFHEAARVLGATEGASRVAVDDGHMPRHRQVGATGTWVTARVYLAVGISGAIQHLQGIQSCDKVIAINLDPGCDMIKRADLAVIGDAAEILAALVARVRVSRDPALPEEEATSPQGVAASSATGTTGPSSSRQEARHVA